MESDVSSCKRPKRRSNSSSCAATNCRNTRAKRRDLSFFRFPKDFDRARSWAINVRRADLVNRTPEYLTKNCTVCSEHFETIMFLNDLKNRLHTHAIPTLMNLSNLSKTGKVRRGRKPTIPSGDAFFTCAICNEKLIDMEAVTHHHKRNHEQDASEELGQSDRSALLTDYKEECHDEEEGLESAVKRNWSQQVACIREEHKSCLELSAEQCCCIVENVLYRVVDSDDVKYTIQQNDAVPHAAAATCRLMCSECNTCVHAFSCNCLDNALHEMMCRHIHLVIQIYKPVRLFTVVSASEDDAADPAANCEPEYSQLHTDDDANDTVQDAENLEEMESRNWPPVSSIGEADSNISDVSSDWPYCETRHLISSAEQAWLTIRTSMEDNIAVAEVVSEHMSRLESLVAALRNQPAETPRLPSASTSCDVVDPRVNQLVSCDPRVNQLVTTQATSTLVRQEQAKTCQLTASKSGRPELDDNNEPVSSHQPLMEHDYSSNFTAHVKLEQT